MGNITLGLPEVELTLEDELIFHRLGTQVRLDARVDTVCDFANTLRREIDRDSGRATIAEQVMFDIDLLIYTEDEQKWLDSYLGS